jgi:hypothetical protein
LDSRVDSLGHRSLNACPPGQIFNIFFSHLTTLITEVDIYLRNKPTLRGQIPTSAKEFTGFSKLAEKVTESMVGPKKKKAAKNGGAAAEEELNKVYEKALSGEADIEPPEKMTPPEKLIFLLGWSNIRYGYEWRTNLRLMAQVPFSRAHRVSTRRGERMMVMSGLSWNKGSQNKPRDWNNINTAITLELALVESYRLDLLRACPGACALRKEMKEYFLTITNLYHLKNPVTGAVEMLVEWAFPDDIPLDIGPCGGKMYDPMELRQALNLGNVTDAAAKPKGKRTKAQITIDSLAKNKLLWCSDPKASHGTLETLAYHCIATLANVSVLLFLPHGYVSDGASHLHVDRSFTSTRRGPSTTDCERTTTSLSTRRT